MIVQKMSLLFVQRPGDVRGINVLYPDVAGLQHDPHPPLHRLRCQDPQHPRHS